MRILIENAAILPMDSPAREISRGYIAIVDGVIDAVGEGQSADRDYERIIDAAGKAALPGFVNAHTHAAMVLLRGYADDQPLMEWLQQKIWPAEAHLAAEDIYWGTRLAIAEMIRSGTTCFNDMYFFMEEVGRAVEETGIRAVLSRGMIGVGPEAERAFPESREMVRKWHGSAGGRITCNLGPHAPYTCQPDYLARVVDLAAELNIGLHIHLAETLAETDSIRQEYGLSPTAYLEKAGVFSRPVIAAHCVHMDPEDMAILEKHQAGVAHCPESNMKLGSGIAPVHEMLGRGLAVGLGTDGASSNNNLDMLQELRSAAFLQKVKQMDPTVVAAYTALQMATRNGAMALGLGDRVGQLKPGFKADIILIDCRGPHMQPLHSVTANVAYSAQAADVDTVIIDGRIVMEERKILTFDEEETIARASELAMDLVKRS